MSYKSAHSSKPATSKDSQLQTLALKPFGPPHAFRIVGDSRSAAQDRPSMSSSIQSPPTPVAHAYIGVSASRPYSRGSQYQGLETALNSTRKLSKNDRDIVQQIQNFNPAVGGISGPMTANPFSNVTSIPDFLANVERTLEPSIDPLQGRGDTKEKSALWSTSLKLNDEDQIVGLSHSTESARDKAPETFRPRGLSVADINMLNAVYEENGDGKERHDGSSIVTQDSSSRIRQGAKFDDKLEVKSLFHGADAREDGNVEDDDKSIELEGGIYYFRKDLSGDGNETCYGDKISETENEEAGLQPDDEMAYPQGSRSAFADWWPSVHAYGLNSASSLHDVGASSTRKAAMGLAKELRRLSLAPEDLVIPSKSAIDTVDSDLDPDMVGGLPLWEFKRAGLGRFVSSTDVEQQEALLEAYEQGLGPEVLSGSSPEEGSDSGDGGHLFVFDRMQSRAAASAVASGSGVGIRRAKVSKGGVACVVMKPEEKLEDGEDIKDEEEEEEAEEIEGGGGEEGTEEELTLEEQEQIDRAMAMSLEDLKHESIGKGKGRAD